MENIEDLVFQGPEENQIYTFSKNDTIVGFIDRYGKFLTEEGIDNHTILAQKIIRENENLTREYEEYVQGSGKYKIAADYLVYEKGYVKVMRRPHRQFMGAGRIIFSYREGRTTKDQDDFVFGAANKYERDVDAKPVPEDKEWENNKWER